MLTKNFICKGPSINDVSSKGEGGGYQKFDFGVIFRAKTGATGGGRGVEKSKIRGDVVYGCSLTKLGCRWEKKSMRFFN